MSSAWGTSQFDGCKFCRRDRNACSMISARHYECLSCRKWIRHHEPANVSGPAKAKYMKALAEKEDLYEHFMAK
eukprot:7873504-Alexandrium_andersonii.AAC.1